MIHPTHSHAPAIDTPETANPAHVVIVNRDEDPIYQRLRRDAAAYREQERYSAAIRSHRSIDRVF